MAQDRVRLSGFRTLQQTGFRGTILALRRHEAGLLVVLTIAGASRFLAEHYGAPTMLFALLIGLAFGFLHTEPKVAPGVDLASRHLLRTGIAVLGAQITLGEILALGAGGMVLICGLVALTIGFGLLLSRLLKRSNGLGLLTGGAVAICGASAAMALSAVIPASQRREQDTICVVVAVTALSTVAMVLYPILFASLGTSPEQSGFLIGATIHDVAQVAGAGYSISDEVGETATIVKLMRVTLLPIVVLAALLSFGRATERGAATFPGFVIAFLGFAIVNSIGLIPDVAVDALGGFSRWCLYSAIAAIGMKTDLAAIAKVGRGVMVMVLAETLFLLLLTCLLVLFGPVSL